MRIAISLLWLRYKSSGGVESFSRNILDGLKNHRDDNYYILVCSNDNADSFTSYENDARFEVYRCDVNTRDTKKMLFYENFRLDRLISRLNVDLCFVPTYRMPLFISKNRYVVVIHDLIAYWYPQNFSVLRRKWLQWGWKRSVKKAKRVVVISEFVRNDIIMHFGPKFNDKIFVIYNPILPSMKYEDFHIAGTEYGIGKYDYFYTVSSTAKHKNLSTIIRMMGEYAKKYGREKTPKLLISGVGQVGPEAKTHFITNEILNLINDLSLEDICILTGFVSDERRNTLMQNAKIFLFPSVFEGFGMPPVEALEMGTPVVTTKCTALPEVTHGKCIYVEDPYSVEEWLNNVEKCDTINRKKHSFTEYGIDSITQSYLNCFNEAGKHDYVSKLNK